jgi:hypothetical protein
MLCGCRACSTLPNIFNIRPETLNSRAFQGHIGFPAGRRRRDGAVDLAGIRDFPRISAARAPT